MTRDARLSALHRGFALPAHSRAEETYATPRSAPHSGSSLEHALNERGCECSKTASLRSQEINSICIRNRSGLLFPGVVGPKATGRSRAASLGFRRFVGGLGHRLVLPLPCATCPHFDHLESLARDLCTQVHAMP